MQSVRREVQNRSRAYTPTGAVAVGKLSKPEYTAARSLVYHTLEHFGARSARLESQTLIWWLPLPMCLFPT